MTPMRNIILDDFIMKGKAYHRTTLKRTIGSKKLLTNILGLPMTTCSG